MKHQYKYFVKVSVFDYRNRIIDPIKSSYDENSTYDLYPGLYTLRISLNGDITDEVFFLEENKSFVIGDPHDYVSHNEILLTPPTQYSSALLGSKYGSSHEYYTGPSYHYSTMDTAMEKSPDLIFNNSLFIFLRYPSVEFYKQDLIYDSQEQLQQFKLVTENGTLVCDFKDNTRTASDFDYGWIAFNKTLPDGIYYLIYSGKEPRQLPVYVFNNWHTQFFMTIGEEPQFGSIRTFLSPYRGLQQDNDDNRYIDTMLDMLQNNDYSLKEDTIKIAAYGKFESPMLGLLCSYIYLKSENSKKDDLFSIISNNIQHVILKDNEDAPDLKALQILASEHFNDAALNTNTPIPSPPMFRIGFEAILQESLTKENLIPLQSMNDYISESLFFDSPYTTFKPVDFKVVKSYKAEDLSIDSKILPESSNDSMPGKILDIDTDDSLLESYEEDSYPEQNNTSGIDSLISWNTIDRLSNANSPVFEDSWLKNAIAENIILNRSTSIPDLSKKLHVSQNTVKRILIEISQETD